MFNGWWTGVLLVRPKPAGLNVSRVPVRISTLQFVRRTHVDIPTMWSQVQPW